MFNALEKETQTPLGVTATFLTLGAVLMLLAGFLAPATAHAKPVLSQPGLAAAVPAMHMTKKLCGAPANQWGLNHCGGKVIYEPPPGFCGAFRCINNFNRGRGYIVQCRSGSYSKSGGVRGACSWHGGVARALYK